MLSRQGDAAVGAVHPERRLQVHQEGDVAREGENYSRIILKVKYVLLETMENVLLKNELVNITGYNVTLDGSGIIF